MIEFTDTTLLESLGFRDEVSSLMGKGAWMLRSDVHVSSGPISAAYMIHFWHNGKMIIKSTDRPINTSAPDDDLRELNQWAIEHGWNRLSVDDLMVEEPSSFQFWLRMYQTGLIHSDILQKYDEDEIKRLSEVYERDEEEEIDAY